MQNQTYIIARKREFRNAVESMMAYRTKDGDWVVEKKYCPDAAQAIKEAAVRGIKVMTTGLGYDPCVSVKASPAAIKKLCERLGNRYHVERQIGHQPAQG